MGEAGQFEATETTFFDAAHKLLDEHYGSGTRLHGHTYHVAVSMRGDTLLPNGMIFDHYAVRTVVRDTVAQFHDRYLNDIPAFEGLNITPEVIARHLWQLIAGQLTDHGVQSMTVEIAESPTMKIRYEAPLPATAGG